MKLSNILLPVLLFGATAQTAQAMEISLAHRFIEKYGPTLKIASGAGVMLSSVLVRCHAESQELGNNSALDPILFGLVWGGYLLCKSGLQERINNHN